MRSTVLEGFCIQKCYPVLEIGNFLILRSRYLLNLKTRFRKVSSLFVRLVPIYFPINNLKSLLIVEAFVRLQYCTPFSVENISNMDTLFNPFTPRVSYGDIKVIVSL